MKIGIITGKSGNTLVSNLVKRGHSVYVLTGDHENGGVNFANDSYCHYFNLQEDNSLHYKNICNWFLKHKIDGLILGTGVWFAHEIAIMLSKQHGIPCSHNVEYISVFKDKIKTKQKFKEFGLKTPEFQFFYDKNTNINLTTPFVVKSNIDLFPVWLCHDTKAFDNFKERINDSVWSKGILIEKFIDGNDLTIPVFATRTIVKTPSLVYWSKQTNYKLEGFGELTNDYIPKELESTLLNESNSMISNLGYYGVCRFDVRVSREDYYYLEINSVVSIRNQGTSFKAMKKVGINYSDKAIDVYLNNLIDHKK